MSKNYCNCPDCRTENCPAGKNEQELIAAMTKARIRIDRDGDAFVRISSTAVDRDDGRSGVEKYDDGKWLAAMLTILIFVSLALGFAIGRLTA